MGTAIGPPVKMFLKEAEQPWELVFYIQETEVCGNVQAI